MEVGFIWFSWCIYICSNVYFLGVNNTKKIMLWNILHCIKQYLMKKKQNKKTKLKTKFYDLESDKTCDILNKWLVK